MKNKFRLQIDLNSPKSKKNVKTPEILRKKDYSPMPVDSPHSIKHRISVIEVETEVSITGQSIVELELKVVYPPLNEPLVEEDLYLHLIDVS